MIVKSNYFVQLRAMLVRNITLKCRERRKLLWEICLPLYSFVVLALMKMLIPNPNYPALSHPAYSATLFDNYSLYLNYTVGVVPNTSAVQTFLDHVSHTWVNWINMNNKSGNELNFVMFDSKEELQETYWHEPLSLPLAVIFYSENPVNDTTLEYVKAAVNRYEIRTNPSFSTAPESVKLYADLINCRENSHVLAKALERSHVLEAESCPAYEYYASGFVTVQMLFDYTKIGIMSHRVMSLPFIDLQLFPKEAVTADWMLLFRIIIPAYLVMSLSQFVMYLLMHIVQEKESKIKETLKIAGLRNSVFWLSWFIIYAVFVVAMSFIATLSMFQLRVFQHSNFFLILVLILLYGFSLIFLSFMVSPFLNHHKTAGIIGNFSINIISLLYFIRIFMVSVDDKYLWLMSFLSPPAFTLALDKALTLDMNGLGLQFDNLWHGPGLSFGNSLIMLLLDNVLYAILAYYLDLVIPGEYETKKKPLFFLKRFIKLWKCIFHPGANARPKMYATSESLNTGDIEPVSIHYKNKVGIEIVGLHKTFTPSCKSVTVAAINGLNLTVYEGQITAILGHNGAGKTTLFNILTGMTAPTAGTAYVFGHDIRKPNGLQIVRKMFGVCPQHNIFFDNLTPKEHLKLYCALRGTSVSEQNSEISEVLKNIELLDQADCYTKFLSGGQKRKLSVGLAVIGSPKVLIFDEPTAGIDPYSRRCVWSLLQKHKAGKVILLTTHYMDEADLLADRKAVISNGQIRCVGSSLFLKNKFGVGYHLTLVMEVDEHSHNVYKLVKRHVPEVELARHHGKELSFILPHNSVTKFAGLFNELETEIYQNGNSLAIASYGISMTTLEEVFLYLEKSEELENQEGRIGNRLLKRRLSNWESRSLRQRRISTNSTTTGSDPNNINGLQTPSNAEFIRRFGFESIEMESNNWKIMKAVICIRLLNMVREPARYLTLALIPLILSVIALHVLRSGAPETNRKSITLNESTYENGTFIIQDFTHSNLMEYFDPSIYLTLEDIDGDLLSVKPNFGAVTINNCCEQLNLSVNYNDTMMHSLPIILNIINNGLYKKFTIDDNDTDNSEEWKITTKSFPFLVRFQPDVFDTSLMTIALGLGLQFIVIPIVFAADYVYDRETKLKNQLRVNGLSFWIYYGTFFFVLVISMMVLLTLHLIVIWLFDLLPFKQSTAFMMLAFCLYLYTPCAILFGTVLSYIFRSAETAQTVLLNATTFIGFLPYGLVLLLEVLKLRAMCMFFLHAVFSMFNSFYLPFAIVYFVGRIYLLCMSNEACTYITFKDYFTPEILIIITSCCLQMPIFLLILQLLEHWKSGNNNISHVGIPNRNLKNTNIEEEHDSDDVKFEKYRVTNYLSTPSDVPDHPLIILQDIKKHFMEGSDKSFWKIFSCSKIEDDKAQVCEVLNGLTFSVGPGEVFGLLGHNGAGKSTTMKILTSEDIPNHGAIQLKGRNLLLENFKNIYKYVGYCPQEDVLWKNITIREHIKLYATIRGIPKDKIDDITEYYISTLQIHDHADKFIHQCSGGTKRKLSFALAMVGNPDIVLMDEPSAGMDPHSKRFMWDAILCNIQGNRGAILTTHAMEEADALCTKVGIMVNGKLKCIGSTQHLKNLYGAGYTLEIKINSVSSGTEAEEKVKQFVNVTFPSSKIEETFCDHLVFSIPQSSVKSLAQCFTEIERSKNILAIEEYSFSQTTLEQVFLKFAHNDERQ